MVGIDGNSPREETPFCNEGPSGGPKPNPHQEIDLDDCLLPSTSKPDITDTESTPNLGSVIRAVNVSQFYPTSISRQLCSDLNDRETLSQGSDCCPALLTKVDEYRATIGPRASREIMIQRFEEMTRFAQKLLCTLPEADLVIFYGSTVRGALSPNDVDVRVLLKPTFLDRISASPSFWVRRFSDSIDIITSLLPDLTIRDRITSVTKRLDKSDLPNKLFDKPLEVFFHDQYYKQWPPYFVEPWEAPPGAMLLLKAGPLLGVARGEDGCIAVMFTGGTKEFDSGKITKQKGLFGKSSEIKI